MCYSYQLTHSRCQACSVAPYTGGRSLFFSSRGLCSSCVVFGMHNVISSCFCSFWHQQVTTTTFVFIKRKMMTGSAGSPYRDTRPQSGVCVLMPLERDLHPAAMIAL